MRTVTMTDATVGYTATVAQGSCSLISLTPGPETLVATCSGEANFLASNSTPVVHTVNVALGPTPTP